MQSKHFHFGPFCSRQCRVKWPALGLKWPYKASQSAMGGDMPTGLALSRFRL